MDDVQQQPKSNLGGITGKGFMPGQSGNPGGRPKGDSVTTWLRRKLQDEPIPGQTRAERIAETIMRAAEDGDPKLIKELLDRTEGKVAEAITTPAAVDAVASVLDRIRAEIEAKRRERG